MKRPERKTALSFSEKITAAYLYYVIGVDQSIIEIALNVTNVGRVNEACVAVRRALMNDAGGRRKGNSDAEEGAEARPAPGG